MGLDAKNIVLSHSYMSLEQQICKKEMKFTIAYT